MEPGHREFGAAPAIYGTLVTSFLALLIAAPIGLRHRGLPHRTLPLWLRRPIGIAVELLAGIPSIIYGIWGMFILAPLLQSTLQPWLINAFADVPVLRPCSPARPMASASPPPSIILAIMILPLISSISRDVFNTVPAGAEGGRLWRRLHHDGK